MAQHEQRGNGYNAVAGAAAAAAHQRKKKRTKFVLGIVIFAIFHTAIVVVFALTILKVKTPKFRIHRATVTALSAGTPANPSLRATVTPEFSVKNTNFGFYKYRDTAVDFFYGGAIIGQVFVSNSRAGWRSTKRFVASAAELNLSGSPQLAADLSRGVVPIASSAQMRGRAELIFILKRKNKATNLNCTMDVVIATQSIANIVCK